MELQKNIDDLNRELEILKARNETLECAIEGAQECLNYVVKGESQYSYNGIIMANGVAPAGVY